MSALREAWLRFPLRPESVKTLPPAYFAVVMATGTVALAANFQENLSWLAPGLTWLNAAIFAVLWAATFARLAYYPERLLADLKDFERGPGFFAMVAGTAVLGTQMLVIFHQPVPGLILWLAAIPLWAA